MLREEDFMVPKDVATDAKDFSLTEFQWTPEPEGTKLKELKGTKLTLRAIIKQVVKESRHQFPDLTEGKLRTVRRKRNKIAKARKIEPGTAAWKKLTRDTTLRGKKRG